MKLHLPALALALIVALPACQSELDDKTAAEVTPVANEVTPDEAPTATSTAPTPGAVVVNVDKEASSIQFVGAKVTRDHTGQFHEFDGWVEYAGDQPSRIAFDIDINSIETDTDKLTEHLKTADFFDVARFPRATFVSTSLSAADPADTSGATHVVRGMLNMHGVEREVTFPVTAEMTPQGTRARSEFTIDRHDWGISYRGAADDLIKDNVLIRLDLRFPPPPAAA